MEAFAGEDGVEDAQEAGAVFVVEFGEQCEPDRVPRSLGSTPVAVESRC